MKNIILVLGIIVILGLTFLFIATNGITGQATREIQGNFTGLNFIILIVIIITIVELVAFKKNKKKEVDIKELIKKSTS